MCSSLFTRFYHNAPRTLVKGVVRFTFLPDFTTTPPRPQGLFRESPFLGASCFSNPQRPPNCNLEGHLARARHFCAVAPGPFLAMVPAWRGISGRCPGTTAGKRELPLQVPARRSTSDPPNPKKHFTARGSFRPFGFPRSPNKKGPTGARNRKL